ncbi:MAG: ABC transporter permease [Chloroflexota bacterium]|jgi:ABC-2 type transport system permease protein|nr:ABC transporter permease [Chloroflexota bacterium]
MNTLGWRLAPIFFLSVRQFTGGKAVRAVLGLSLIPALFALIYRIDPDIEDPRRFLDDIILQVMLPSILPLAALILATGALGDEIDDRTLPYLMLKPISRFRIVVEKLLSATVVSIPIIALGGLISFFLVFTGDAGDNLDILWAIVLATAVGVLLYSSIFMLLSLLIRRAILASIIYSIVWETVLGRFIPGLRYVSIRQVVTSVYTSTLPKIEPNRRADFGLGSDDAFSLNGAVVGALVVCVIAILLSTWRLRKINIE